MILTPRETFCTLESASHRQAKHRTTNLVVISSTNTERRGIFMEFPNYVCKNTAFFLSVDHPNRLLDM